MSSYKNLFPGGSTVVTTSPLETSRAEISLRDEFEYIINGGDGGIPKGQNFILRRMRSENGSLIECPCIDETTREPQIDYKCPYCLGEYYLWDEELVVGYKTKKYFPGVSDQIKREYGITQLAPVVFYLGYLTEPNVKDRIIIIELDLEGDPVVPYNRLNSYEIELLRDLRSDNGRVEYWACYCSSMNLTTEANT